MKKLAATLLVGLVALVFLCGCSAGGGGPAAVTETGNEGILSQLSADRLASLETIQKLSEYDDLNIYSMDVKYDYDIGNLTPGQIASTQEIMNLVFEEAAPGVDFSYEAPDYGCSAFTIPTADGRMLMGRNYDFKYDSSVMIVRCFPEDGYASVAHAALDNIIGADPFESDYTRAACLAAPFICIDGINEKGVGVAVLTLDSDPVNQDSGKPKLATTILVRLVLDKAASTEEAIKLLEDYDMYAIAGRDYHFYITDSTGDSRVAEFDCDSEDRRMVVTQTRSVTNFYICHEDKVQPNQKNGSYGHGRERFDAMEEIFNAEGGVGDGDIAWKALKAASQEPNPDSVTSNTQWSIVYDLTGLKYEFVLHRHWDDVYSFTLSGEERDCHFPGNA